MRIERHQVGGAVVSAAREDFSNRIGGQVRSASRAGRMATYEWQFIAEEFLDYLGALSVETPDLGTAEARAVLKDASEAAAGAVAYAAYHPHCSFQVFLEYVNFGVSYDPGEDAPEESVTPGEWIDALCLTVLRDKASFHGEAFHFAREKFVARVQGTPTGELATALMAVVLDDTGDDEDYPPSAQAKLAAVDAALDRVRARARESGEPLLDRRDSGALRALRALAAEDREAWDAELADLFAGHAAAHGPGAPARTLLPLVPIALASFARRTLGWAPAVHTEYLPHALVTGFEARGPRVEGFGRNRRPDAVAALAAGPLVVDRPAYERTLDARVTAIYRERLQAASTPTDRGDRIDAGAWQRAVAFALITGVRQDLAPLVLAGPQSAGQDGSAFNAYREALHAYLKGADPEAAAQKALEQEERAKDWGFAMPPAVLLSQLVEGDEESFNLALADALEAHRDHYEVADRANDPDASINLDILALACHARRRGWAIRVDSAYLPKELLRAAEPFQGVAHG
ncbi:immunity 49 family protein [Streptomyces sp. CS014]|uniref:immunity 49 family protein n=1 Tax=Streptomyces sp. CS014 TaxID=2162707 RepID=UPI001EF5F968|nr:immunity 49 family protein [Streptomyces sp. CS014]